MNNELREFWEEKTRKAVEKAERKNSIKTAKAMLEDSTLSYEKIAKYSGLTVDEVKEPRVPAHRVTNKSKTPPSGGVNFIYPQSSSESAEP